MKKIIALLCVVFLLLGVGCKKNAPAGSVNPYSSTIEEASSELEPTESTPKKSTKKQYQTTGGEDVFLSLMDDDDTKSTTALVEKGTSVPTLQTPWDKMTYAPCKAGSDAAADVMRNKIINAGNTSEYYTWSGKTYYVSPDGNDSNDGMSPKTAVKTLDADVFLMSPPQPGDAVLFERGGLWRLTNRIRTRKGVTYGSYGTGEKPTFYGSPANYADQKYWAASKKKNIWKLTIPDSDIGLIVFDHGELVGHKKFNGLTVLEKNGDYYYNTNDDTIYLYYDKGNPGNVYKDIEVCLNLRAFGVNYDDVVIDNFKIKYFGEGAVYAGGSNNNLTVTNCECGFIGGRQHTGTTRAGNCIQQWNSTDKQLVANNWMYQAFDTGYSFQGNDRDNPGTDENGNLKIGPRTYYNNITVRDNLIEYCNYGVEYWHEDQSQEPKETQIQNFTMTGNIIRYSGYSWSKPQRPDFSGYAWYTGNRSFKNAKNCVITDNTFDIARRSLMYWSFPGAVVGEWTFSGNTFYQTHNTRDEAIWYGSLRTAADQNSLETAVSILDETPKLVKWLE